MTIELPKSSEVALPGISKLGNANLFMACLEKQVNMVIMKLELRSIVLVSKFLIMGLRAVIKPLLVLEGISIPRLGPVNIDIAVNDVKIKPMGDVPKCLQGISSSLMKAGVDALTNSVTSALNSIDLSSIGAATGAIGDSLNFLENKINSALASLDEALGNLMDATDKVLFTLLDAFNEFLEATSFVDTYSMWVDGKKCLEKNCEHMNHDIVDDEFLYYDEDKKEFIMPVDIGSGKLKIHKFLEDPSKFEKKSAGKIESRYNAYVRKKKQIIKQAAQQTGGESSPFASLL